MEYIIIGLLILIIILLIIVLVTKKDNNDMTERLGRFETNITKEIGEFKLGFTNN